MTEDANEKKKPLTRDQILKAENEPKVYQIPSGKMVRFAFLSLNMALEIEESVEVATEGEKERVFIDKVFGLMLRANEQIDFRAFSEEDRHRLIEIAVEEWGCEEEYEQFAEIVDLELRFYEAVQLQEKEHGSHLSESMRAISVSLASAVAPFKGIQDQLASSLLVMGEKFNEVSKPGEAFNWVNARALEQMGEIYQFQSPILGITEALTKLQHSLVIPDQKVLLESMSGTLIIYQKLMRDVIPIEKFAILPDAVRYYPTLEVRNTSIVTAHLVNEEIDQLQVGIITPDKNELIAWLETLDTAFPNMLLGAEQTIHSQNPDHCRHFASSHRELSTHILHLLAPDEAVKKWTKDPNHFDKDSKPTRKARLKYIARNHSNNTFVDFVVKDFENQMALLNADEHRKAQEYTSQQLNALHSRFLSTLGFLLAIVSSHS